MLLGLGFNAGALITAAKRAKNRSASELPPCRRTGYFVYVPDAQFHHRIQRKNHLAHDAFGASAKHTVGVPEPGALHVQSVFNTTP